VLNLNAGKFCSNKFHSKFGSNFELTLILKTIEMNLMGEKGLQNQTKRRSRPVLERINFEIKICVTIIFNFDDKN
jgi:hypothetical protein